jgi:hypothetical protein
MLRKSKLSAMTAWVSKHCDKVSYLRIHRGKKRTQGTETSKYLQERTSTETPQVVASERGPGQWPWGIKWNGMESPAVAGDSPVHVEHPRSLSKAGHVKSCLKLGGPPSKPKYSCMTDSEQVP